MTTANLKKIYNYKAALLRSYNWVQAYLLEISKKNNRKNSENNRTVIKNQVQWACVIQKRTTLKTHYLRSVTMKNTFKKQTAKIATLITITALAAPFFLGKPMTTYACDTVEACQTQLEQLQADNAQAQKELESSQSSFATTEERVNSAQALANSIQAEIDAYQATIDSLNKQMQELETKITELQASIDEKEALLRERLVDMQLRVKTNQFLDFLVNSESLSDMLSRAHSIQQLTAYDNSLIQEIEAEKAEIEAHKVTIAETKTEVEALKAEAQTRQEEQNSVLATLKAERQALAKEVLGAQGLIDSIGLSEADIQAQLDILASYVAPTPESGGSTEGSTDSGGSSEVPQAGGFYRPTSGVVTLPYMSTEYPYSSSRPHLGVDIGAAEGTPVVSVTDGVVIQASYGDNGGYGNMVVISHNVNGTPMVSIYGHLSSISVSAGQTVSGGQNIGAVGNTGNSFGAHLHIEMLSGINYMPAGREERQQYTVNPANYF